MAKHRVRAHFRRGKRVASHLRRNRRPSKRSEIINTPLGPRKRDVTNKMFLGSPTVRAWKRKRRRR